MAPSTTVSWWQYARWVVVIARNMRITEPTGAELAAVIAFLKAIWDPQTRTGTRDGGTGRIWLDTMYKKNAISAASGNEYEGNLDDEPTHALVEILNSVGRNLDNIPISELEKALVDTLIAATGNRRFGTGPLFGGMAGSVVTIP